jgi:hypothetical protein
MKHAYWVIDGMLAGRPGPSLVPWDLMEIAKLGVGGLVSLCGNVSPIKLQETGINHLQIDSQFSAEVDDQIVWFSEAIPMILELISRCRENGKATLVHCHHGLDRTGVVLGCCLIVLQRQTAQEAIVRIQLANRDALQNEWHREAILNFENQYRQNRSRYWRKTKPSTSCDPELS